MMWLTIVTLAQAIYLMLALWYTLNIFSNVVNKKDTSVRDIWTWLFAWGGLSIFTSLFIAEVMRIFS